jgi:hypothetical protein
MLVSSTVVRAEDKPPAASGLDSSWSIDQSLTISPQAAPTPAFKYRLLPDSWELKDGNAVPIYLRLTHEQSDAARKHFIEAPKQWNALPLDKIPLAEAKAFLHEHQYMLRQLELGARRRTVEWDYTLDEPNRIGLLLPDVQWMRNYVPMLVLQARVALAERDFAAAAHHLETGFAFSRHVADGPTLIHGLVGCIIATEFANTVAEFISQPDAPNLYWALTALPRPLIDMRAALGFEHQIVEEQFPELNDLDRDLTTGQWDAVLRRVRSEIRGLALGTVEDGKRKLPDWFPKDFDPETPAAKSPELAAARQFVARTKGISAEKADAMPPAQVLLVYMMGMYREDRDDWFRASYLPYPEARPAFNESKKRLNDAPNPEGHILARTLLPALDKVMSRQMGVERHLAALRVIEAMRIYAAAHEGRLPKKLGDISEVPVPNDPGREGPFEHLYEDGSGTLLSRSPAEHLSYYDQRYRLTLRQK